MSWQRFFLIAFSAVPLLLAAWIWNLSVELGLVERSAAAAVAENLPDLLADEVVYLQFDVSGMPVQRLSSTRALGFNQGAEVRLDSPSLLVVSSDATRWSASSLRGYIDQPGGRLDLVGDVVLNRLGEAGARLITSSLAWLPASATAFTNDAVVVESQGNRLQSQGISIDLDRANFHLVSQVRGTHVLP